MRCHRIPFILSEADSAQDGGMNQIFASLMFHFSYG